MQSSAASTRLSIAIMLAVLVSIVVMEASANPSPEHTGEAVNVVDAIRYLQDIENKHAQFARPRFGKRGGGNSEYLNKEYTNNFLRFMLENPEYLQQLQQQQES